MSFLLRATYLVAVISGTLAAPARLEVRQEAPFTQTSTAWNSGAVTQYPIHSSCNVTQAHQIATGLNETLELVGHARDHVLRWGNNSEIYRRYFGDRPPFEVMGAYDIIVNGDKGGVLFRCDNPDGNCNLKGWGGHWRGSNATDETVICDLSYQTRRSLSQMCALGYTVIDSPTNTFWASDLLHRLYHMPAIGWGHIEHYADDYDEVIELAAGNTTESTHDSDTLQYFALEVYAYDIAIPGVGCAGNSAASEPAQSTAPAVASSTTSAAPAPVTTSSGSPTLPQTSSSTITVPANCHTHEGGVVHCS